MKLMEHTQKRRGRLYMGNNHFVYILECKDETLYTGYTINVDARVRMHESGKGAKYTRGRGPFHLQYVEAFKTKKEAMRREFEIKKLTKKQKQYLIRDYQKEGRFNAHTI